MLASIFIIQGLDAVLHPDKKVPAAEPVVRPIAERASFVPDDVEQVVRLNGAVQLVAGSMLALGRVPRLSALAIAASLLPTTYAGHRFWETDDKQERTQQRIHFLKNVSIFGGLLIAAADTGGNPSLAWRGRHAVSSAKRDVALAAKTQARTARTSAKVAKASARAGRVAGLLPTG
jgi:putative oxidoreductase